MSRGTPKDLSEVVYHILTTPGRDLRVRTQVIIKDYLAQRFGAFMLKYPECEKVLEELFAECVKPLSGPVPTEPKDGEET